MCDMAVDLDAVAARFAPPEPDFSEELAALRTFEEEGLIEVKGSRIRVKEAARPALRIVAPCSTPIWRRVPCLGMPPRFE